MLRILATPDSFPAARSFTKSAILFAIEGFGIRNRLRVVPSDVRKLPRAYDSCNCASTHRSLDICRTLAYQNDTSVCAIFSEYDFRRIEYVNETICLRLTARVSLVILRPIGPCPASAGFPTPSRSGR